MLGHTHNDILLPEEIDYWKRATELVAKIDESLVKVDDLRCHEVTRAVALRLGLMNYVVDGKFSHCDHSWIVLPTFDKFPFYSAHEEPPEQKKRLRGTVLDCYSVARVPLVQLVVGHIFTVDEQRKLYQVGVRREDINETLITRLTYMMMDVQP